MGSKLDRDLRPLLNDLLRRSSGVNPNMAERTRGYYGEAAYHLLP